MALRVHCVSGIAIVKYSRFWSGLGELAACPNHPDHNVRIRCMCSWDPNLAVAYGGLRVKGWLYMSAIRNIDGASTNSESSPCGARDAPQDPAGLH